jgi:hypothetical protein
METHAPRWGRKRQQWPVTGVVDKQVLADHIPIVSEMPHGGLGASGFGKDLSSYSFEEYLAIKHVMSDITGTAEKSWHRTVFSLRD